ncbi:MAG: histidine kinase, partial [Lewinella sp.]|nr:histidine kinase [Lewinella sp.]
MKRISWLEIAGHLAFWLLTTWVVTQLFSIERYEIEAIDGREEITITKFWGFTRFLLVGQLLRLVFFYGYLRLLRPWTTGAGRFPSLAGKAVILLLICLGLEGGFWLLYPPREPEAFPWLLVGGHYGFYWATATAYGFVQAWIRQSAARQALDLEKKKAELALLRSQLQPHFLFNTLNNLLAMVDQRTHPALADGFERLSDLLRYVVYETEQERVPLARELDFVRNYAELALLRFEETEV